MSVLVSDLIDRTLVSLADPKAQRTKRTEALQFFNEIQFDIATRMKCLENDDYFNLVTGEPRYAYPDDMMQFKKIRIAKTTTPSDLGDYYYLEEYFEEKYRQNTHYYRPSGYVWAYNARAGWVEVIGTPTVDVIDGGIMTSWHHPTWLLSETNTIMEIPDFLQDYVRVGMEIRARLGTRELVFGNSLWEKWQTGLGEVRGSIEDKSDDKRASLRPPGHDSWLRGQR